LALTTQSGYFIAQVNDHIDGGYFRQQRGRC
jgi:hypothetical protein